MLSKNAFVVLTIFYIICISSVPVSYSDTAQVMPKGVHRVELQNKFWLPITQGYNTHGEKVDLGSAYTVPLNSNGIEALALIEEASGMAAGSASLGHTEIDMTMNYNDVILYYQYGLTDKLTIGAEIPYYWQWTDVDKATVNTEDATVGLNPTGQGPPLLPIEAGGVANGDMAMELL